MYIRSERERWKPSDNTRGILYLWEKFCIKYNNSNRVHSRRNWNGEAVHCELPSANCASTRISDLSFLLLSDASSRFHQCMLYHTCICNICMMYTYFVVLTDDRLFLLFFLQTGVSGRSTCSAGGYNAIPIWYKNKK